MDGELLAALQAFLDWCVTRFGAVGTVVIIAVLGATAIWWRIRGEQREDAQLAALKGLYDQQLRAAENQARLWRRLALRGMDVRDEEMAGLLAEEGEPPRLRPGPGRGKDEPVAGS
jgi:nitrogen fixation-related uncharacterized protein